MNVTKQTDDLIKSWLFAKRRVEDAKRELESAECAERNAENDLIVHLVPDDVIPGETFNIWYLDGLLNIRPRQQCEVASIAEWRTVPTIVRTGEIFS